VRDVLEYARVGPGQTVFTTLCFAQLRHVLAIRPERSSIIGPGFAGNPKSLATVAPTIGLQLMLVHVPEFNALFRTVPSQPLERAGLPATPGPQSVAMRQLTTASSLP